MKFFYSLILLISIFACNKHKNTSKKDFIGTWHLVSISDKFADKGVIIYSPDGHMSAILSNRDSMVVGYSGKYEINLQESYVKHFRDFYTTLPYPIETKEPIFIRDFSFSNDKKTLILKPREEKGLELVWEKVK